MNIAWFFTLSSVCVYFDKNISYCLDREQEQDQHQDPESGKSFFANCSLKFKAVILILQYLIYSLFSSFSYCRRGGVLDHQPGPVPEHQHHVHPLSESSHSSRSGSQHQVRWCVTCTDLWPTETVEACCSWSRVSLIALYRLANGSASLIAVGNTSRSEFIKHLKRYSSSSGQVRPAASPSSFRTNRQVSFIQNTKTIEWVGRF